MKHSGKGPAKNPESGVLSNMYRNGLFVMAIVFLLFQINMGSVSSMLQWLLFTNVINSVLFFSYAFLFIIYEKTGVRACRIALIVIFVLFMLNFATAFLGLGNLGRAALASTSTSLFSLLYYFPLLMLAFFLISTGWILYRSKYKKIAYVFFIFAIVMFGVLGYFIGSHSTFIPSDETFIVLAQVKPFLHGISPYGNNVGKELYYNYTQNVIETPTFNTLNEIVGVLNYPALYLLVSVPFYPPWDQTLYGISNAVKNQFIVFLVPLIFAVFLVLNKRLSKKPAYWVVLFLSFLMAMISTPVEFLMMALLILAYAYLESDYVWIILGLCISLQELLWLPVAFMLLYTLSNYGIRKAAYNAIGTMAVFLAINAYFIILNPIEFVNGVLTPINGFLLPSSNAIFSYMVNAVYGTSLAIDGIMFAAVAICLAIIFLAFNNKKLIGIFSLVPLMFTLHSDIVVFSVFFVVFTVVSLYIEDKKETVALSKKTFPYKRETCFAIGGIIIMMLAVVAESHVGYMRNFNMMVTNQTASFNASNGTEFFSAYIIPYNVSNSTVYVKIIAYTNYGPINLAVSPNYNNSALSCSGQLCRFNFGEINLYNGTAHRLEAGVLLDGNKTNVYAEQLLLYNGAYAYHAYPLVYPNGSIMAQRKG